MLFPIADIPSFDATTWNKLHNIIIESYKTPFQQSDKSLSLKYHSHCTSCKGRIESHFFPVLFLIVDNNSSRCRSFFSLQISSGRAIAAYHFAIQEKQSKQRQYLVCNKMWLNRQFGWICIKCVVFVARFLCCSQFN